MLEQQPLYSKMFVAIIKSISVEILFNDMIISKLD